MNERVDTTLDWTKLLKIILKEQRHCVFQLLALCQACFFVFLFVGFLTPESSSISFSLTTAGTSHRSQNVISNKIHHNYAVCRSLPTLICPLQQHNHCTYTLPACNIPYGSKLFTYISLSLYSKPLRQLLRVVGNSLCLSLNLGVDCSILM